MYRMVIADDEEIILQGLREIIDWRALGFELVACFEDGGPLLDALKGGLAVDLILTDIRMERVSGIDVARFVRERGLDTEVVLLSGYRDFEYARQAIAYGVTAYLTKPCSIAEIQTTFAQLCDKLDRARTARAALEEQQRSVRDMHEELLSLYEARRGQAGPGENASAPNTANENVISAGNTAVAGTAHAPAVRAACEYIRAHCGEALSLTGVARKTYMHPSYLSRVFKQVTGETFKAYLTACRIERANALLADPRIKVYDIAVQVGYRDIRHFYEVYKRQTGRTPSMYRAELGMRNLTEEGDARA